MCSSALQPGPVRAALFDLDGTLLEVAPDNTACARAMAQIYAEHGFTVSYRELYEDWTGRPPEENRPDLVWEGLESRLGRPVEESVRARLIPLMTEVAHHGRPLRPMPGAREYVSSARRLGLRVALVTGGARQWVYASLPRIAPVEWFDCVITAEDVSERKPSPECYLGALEAVGVSASETVAFEDSPQGVAAARAAGVPCVAIPSPLFSHEDFGGAVARLSSLEEMPLEDLLTRIA